MWIRFLVLGLLANTALAHNTYWGKKVKVGHGYARTYVETTHQGKPSEIGIALTHGALHGLPHEMKEYSLELPKDAPEIAPYEHMTLDWNPHGHEPGGVYDLPHFDFHFYFITKAAREAISCMGPDAAVCMKAISPDYLAYKYVPTPAGVPQMGWHWVDSLSGEFHGKTFTKTYVYGYYDAKPIFVEPMITLDYLMKGTTVVKQVRLPKDFGMHGYFPGSYKISKRGGLHKIALRKFKLFH